MAAWPYNTARWQRLRLAHLKRFPLCEGCEKAGRGAVRANTVDHRRPISDGGPAFPAHDGLASYCASCHSQKTARGSEAGAVRTTRALQPRKGCDANGWPLDAAHPWNARKSLTAGQPKTDAPLRAQLVSKRD
ncbi:HNH endonuclease signature motif containing protein [uncultured Sphingomonas sp.]|mgnify:CR=1 FL=1|uniref:HNH endonuclease signature motif containing protein n=1 Tax=uncultured Sphingomonas sp. TaxID=158754 RepID=UPI002639AC3B|nr:HNH endonuclease signature motif containing protein [uncultured Sphingomonas sp.]